MGMYDDQSSPEDRGTFKETMRLWDKHDRNKGVNKMTTELIKQEAIDYEKDHADFAAYSSKRHYT